MIQKLIVHCPVSSLSLGQVSFNVLRELYRRKVQVLFFPYSQPDFSAFKLDTQFGSWIERSANQRYEKLDRKIPTLNIWHLLGGESRLSDTQVTLTFHETDSPTKEEVAICNHQDFTFFTSNWSVDNFKTYGATNVGFVPLGMDEDFVEIPHRQVSNDITHWVLGGAKFEKRKNTELIIKAWVKKYGGNRAHQLTLAVNNPFFKPDQMQQAYNVALNGNKPFNVNILPALKTNAEMNALYNSADIDLSGLASAEGWNIPAHTSTCLGKWSVVLNATAHKDWATTTNSILVEPTGMRSVVDNIFFQNGGIFNQGNIYDVTEEAVIDGMERAEKKAKTPNLEGKALRKAHTYGHMVDQILAKIETISV
jgi:hypothetical protein